MRRPISTSITTAVIVGLMACQRDAGAVQRPASAGTKASAGSNTQSSVKTWPADADPCGWITPAEAAKILGPLDGAPWRASHAEGAGRDANGYACGYTLAGGRAGDERIAVELITKDVLTTESAFGMMNERFAGEGSPEAFKIAAQAVGLNKKTAAGWDFTGGVPDLFTARIGALVVEVGIYTNRVSEDAILQLASLVRERVPDLPRASENAANGFGLSSQKDACTLITQAEAEAVLGKLTMPPYRSDHNTPNADPGGEGCSYYLGNHRVFTIDPSWEQGKDLFPMAAGMGQKVTSVIGAKGESADTLEGVWDQAAAASDGTLYFLKGDTMLEMAYRTAAIDKPKALKLATIALNRLASGK